MQRGREEKCASVLLLYKILSIFNVFFCFPHSLKYFCNLIYCTSHSRVASAPQGVRAFLEAFEGAKPLSPTAPPSTPHIWPGPSRALYSAFLAAPLCLFTPCSPVGSQFI